jgi:hypothetical protein
MITVFALAAQLVAAVPSDTPPPPASPTRQRVKAIEVSDWYNRRLVIHRALSYTVIPLFGFQAVAGNQIWVAGSAAPAWARTGHRYGAATIAGVFTVNTITGLWNLWDSRKVPQGRALRLMHATSMLVADAGFTWAGAKLSEQAERDMSKRRLHRTVAITSMGITLTSGLLMKFLNR